MTGSAFAKQAFAITRRHWRSNHHGRRRNGVATPRAGITLTAIGQAYGPADQLDQQHSHHQRPQAAMAAQAMKQWQGPG
jgi:hypothetical protein